MFLYFFKSQTASAPGRLADTVVNYNAIKAQFVIQIVCFVTPKERPAEWDVYVGHFISEMYRLSQQFSGGFHKVETNAQYKDCGFLFANIVRAGSLLADVKTL